jgi:hypothetical protein
MHYDGKWGNGGLDLLIFNLGIIGEWSALLSCSFILGGKQTVTC